MNTCEKNGPPNVGYVNYKGKIVGVHYLCFAAKTENDYRNCGGKTYDAPRNRKEFVYSLQRIFICQKNKKGYARQIVEERHIISVLSRINPIYDEYEKKRNDEHASFSEICGVNFAHLNVLSM